MRKYLTLTALVPLLVAATGPKFGTAGGVGAANSTYNNGEPTGGAFSINGVTGVATFNRATLGNPLALSSGGTGVTTAAALDLVLPSKCVNVQSFGADRTGTLDSLPAFNAALAYANCLYAPAGTYKLSGLLTYTYPSSDAYRSITIKGDGAEVTVFNMTSPDAEAIRLNMTAVNQSFHLRDFTLLAPNPSTFNAGIHALGVTSGTSSMQSDVSGVTIRGSDGFNVNNRYFNGVFLERVSNVNLTGLSINGAAPGQPYASVGNGIYVLGTATALPIQINLTDSQVNYYGNGFVYGPYVQGVQIVHGNFTGNGTGIYQPSGQVGNDQLSVTGSQFNSGTRDIYLASAIDGVTLTGNLAYLAPNGTAAFDLFGGQMTVTGNAFVQFAGGTGGTAININSYSLDGSNITGNNIENFVTGIALQPGAANVTSSNNTFNDTANRYFNNSLALNNIIRDSGPVTVSGTTGLGSGGAVSTTATSDTEAGNIGLNVGSTAGSSSGATGISFQFAAPTEWVCTMSANNGSASWANGASFATKTVSRTVTQIFWSNNGAALSSGSTYYISYRCSPR